ncbi:hypothetical protein [Longimicrobium sp.]|uniref:hypothetical protein n=1 Tax=Longimicrobium sp. TaxID=2029185 RepID=UPI002E358850|nr:hypothetical protein [Longimicrobium sp.]HEX6039027.1 hypothetical protein [Longimicrobium sp.]
MRYRLYGLSVETDRPLPGLAPAGAPGPADLRMWLGAVPPHVFPPVPELPWYTSPRVTLTEEPSLRAYRSADGAFFRFHYADGTELRVDAAGTRVACTWPAPLTLEDAATYLLGSLFGFVLRLRGIPALHASAVALGDRTVAICGPAGAGKSTTAAAFAARGRPVLADDVVALREGADGLCVQPAYPHLRLWPDVLPALGTGDLPPLTPNWDKRFRDLAAAGAFHDAPLPLGAVYVLGGREEDDAPRLEPLPPAEAVLQLVGNAYMGWLPDAAARARDLAVFGRVARALPVVRVIPHADPRRVGALCDAIEADFTARTMRMGGTDA